MKIEDIESLHDKALHLLDNYDHQCITMNENHIPKYTLNYNEAISLVSKMKFNNNNDLFGIEKDDSFQSSIELINQEIYGNNAYISLEERAANLLYLIVKNHSFIDGNKRIAASIFLYYLYMNGYFEFDKCNKFEGTELSSLTILIALSKSSDKELIINYITNVL